MAEIVLARAKPDLAMKVVSSVCRVAIAWGDAALWQRAVRACDADRAISELKSQNALSAIEALGLDAVKPWYRLHLLSESFGSSRIWVAVASKARFCATRTAWPHWNS